MPRVELKPNLFDDLIESLGNNVKWYKSCVCSCINRHSGQPNYACPICHGEGYRYLDPIQLVVGVTSLNGNYSPLIQSIEELGNAYVTPKRDVIMGHHDKLEFIDFKCTFSEPLHINYEEDGYGISPETKRNILSVEFCANDKWLFTEGLDFEVTEDRHHIKFTSKLACDVANGADLSILYYTTPIYLVDNILHELRGTRITYNSASGKPYYTELPKQYHVHRIDFDYGVTKPSAVELNEEVVINGDNKPKRDSAPIEEWITIKDPMPKYELKPLENIEDCPNLPGSIKARVERQKEEETTFDEEVIL